MVRQRLDPGGHKGKAARCRTGLANGRRPQSQLCDGPTPKKRESTTNGGGKEDGSRHGAAREKKDLAVAGEKRPWTKERNDPGRESMPKPAAADATIRKGGRGPRGL